MRTLYILLINLFLNWQDVKEENEDSNFNNNRRARHENFLVKILARRILNHLYNKKLEKFWPNLPNYFCGKMEKFVLDYLRSKNLKKAEIKNQHKKLVRKEA